MTIITTISGLNPTSYWPLDEAAGSPTVRDEQGLHAGVVGPGVTLGAVPFGSSTAPAFDGEIGSLITIPDDVRYSLTCQNMLTVAAWICPRVLNFRHTEGSADRYVYFAEKAVHGNQDVEWSLRLYNQQGTKPSRLSFYLFNAGRDPGKGAGAYRQYQRAGDPVEVKAGEWYFVVGQGEPWMGSCNASQVTRFFKQGELAVRSSGDKYLNPQWNVRPHHAPGQIAIGGSIGANAFEGAVAHVALWNRLLTPAEVQQIWLAGSAELFR